MSLPERTPRSYAEIIPEVLGGFGNYVDVLRVEEVKNIARDLIRPVYRNASLQPLIPLHHFECY